VSVNPISPDVFQGGQLTDLPVFTGTFNGTEIVEIVAAPYGQSNAAAGVNYQISTALLAALLSRLQLTTVIIEQGQYTNPANPYIPGAAVSRIYVNKPIAEVTYIQFGEALNYFGEPLVKDIAGTATAGLGITVTFTGGQSADGNTTVPIETGYGGYFFRPILSIGTWTLGSS
jgi:hypothetical protein